jgi:predicted nucleic acid-binding protein
MILLDTNILTISKQTGHPDFVKVTERLMEFLNNEEELIICPQNMYEFFVVVTRPVLARGGMGLSKKKALDEIKILMNTYRFINDPENLFITWQQIIGNYDVSGKQGHDARLAAFMVAHGIDRIYTMNDKDFIRYGGIITVLN